MQRKPIKVLCVDDSDLVADAIACKLRAAKGFRWLGRVPDAEALAAAAAERKPDVVLLDIDMPGKDAFVALEELLIICPEARVLMLTAFVSNELIERALDAGAWGYLSKNDGEALVQAIQRVADGEFVLGPNVVAEFRKR